MVDCKAHETEYVSPTGGVQNRAVLDIRVFVLHKIVFWRNKCTFRLTGIVCPLLKQPASQDFLRFQKKVIFQEIYCCLLCWYDLWNKFNLFLYFFILIYTFVIGFYGNISLLQDSPPSVKILPSLHTY